MKKYILKIRKNGVCTCNDTVNKVTCTFVKGWYNKTVKFDYSNYTGDPLKIARVLRKMTDFLCRKLGDSLANEEYPEWHAVPNEQEYLTEDDIMYIANEITKRTGIKCVVSFY